MCNVCLPGYAKDVLGNCDTCGGEGEFHIPEEVRARDSQSDVLRRRSDVINNPSFATTSLAADYDLFYLDMPPHPWRTVHRLLLQIFQTQEY